MMRLFDLHAASCAGDPLITIGLAGTIFFNAPLGEARAKVALYLLVTLTSSYVVPTGDLTVLDDGDVRGEHAHEGQQTRQVHAHQPGRVCGAGGSQPHHLSRAAVRAAAATTTMNGARNARARPKAAKMTPMFSTSHSPFML